MAKIAKNLVETFASFGVAKLIKLITGLISFVAGVATGVVDILKAAASQVTGVIAKIASIVGGIITGLVTKVLKKLGDLLGLNDILKDIWAGFNALGTTIKDLLKKLFCAIGRIFGRPCETDNKAGKNEKRETGSAKDDVPPPEDQQSLRTVAIVFTYKGKTYAKKKATGTFWVRGSWHRIVDVKLMRELQDASKAVEGENCEEKDIKKAQPPKLDGLDMARVKKFCLLDLSTFVNESGTRLRIDWDYIDPSDKFKRSNRKRMAEGLSPFISLGVRVELHHVKQSFFEKVDEVSATFHRMGLEDPDLHPFANDPGYDSWRHYFCVYNGSLTTLEDVAKRIKERYWIARI